MKHLLLLGSGLAHLQVLQAFADAPLPGTQVTLLAPHARVLAPTMLAGLVAGHYVDDDCAIALAPPAARAKARLVVGDATALDAKTRRLSLADGQVLHYDALSIATGAVTPLGAIAGADEHAIALRPAERFFDQWEELFARTQLQILSVVVIGGGAAGVEMALALQYRLRERARVTLVTGGAAPLAGRPRRVRAHALRVLKRLGVTVLEDRCLAIGSQHVTLGRGMRLECDAPVLASGASAPDWLARSGVALDDDGLVVAAPTLQSVSHPEVFVAGDIATIGGRVPREDDAVDRQAGAALALNLRRHVAGGPLERWRRARSGPRLMACGERRAIASWGPWVEAGRWVWWWKDRADRRTLAALRG